MKRAIIIHGYYDELTYKDQSRPAASNDLWIPWLQRQLLLQRIEAQTPEMPGFYEPRYPAWKATLDCFAPDENTILVGHSCGAGFLVRWLSESKQKVGKAVLVAPWLDPDKHIDPAFFEFEINPKIAQKTSSLTVMYSTDDGSDVILTIQKLKAILVGIEFQEFKDKGHFAFVKFPELLDNLLRG